MNWEVGIWGVCIAATVAFAVAFQLSRIVARVRTTTEIAKEAIGILAEKSLNDEEKERLVQR